MFADKKSHSPDRAASGVKHDMFVDFMMWFRYVLRSLGATEAGKLVSAERRDAEGALRDPCADINPVLPLELGPHAAELRNDSRRQ
jgi:hypothetical protein